MNDNNRDKSIECN